MSKTKQKKRDHKKPVLQTSMGPHTLPQTERFFMRAEKIDMAPYYFAFGDYYNEVAPAQEGLECPVLLAVDEVPGKRSFRWVKNDDGVVIFLFTPRLSIPEFLMCLKNRPNDSECDHFPAFSINNISNCLDLDGLYTQAAFIAVMLDIPCPQVIPSDAIPYAGEIHGCDGIPGGKPYLIFLNAHLTITTQFKVITHEMRHAWQHYTDPVKYFANYRPYSAFAGSKEEKDDQFFQQEAELDAEAYALAIMNRQFDIPLDWTGYSEENWKRLEARAREYLSAPERHCIPKCA